MVIQWALTSVIDMWERYNKGYKCAADGDTEDEEKETNTHII